MMRRRVLIAVFLAVVLSVLIGGHAYLITRLIIDPQLAAPWRGWLVALTVVLAMSLVLQPIGERYWPRGIARTIAWVASLWMGFAFLLLVLLLVSDVVWTLLGAAVPVRSAGFTGLTAARLRAMGVIAFAASGAFAAVRNAVRPPALRRIEITLARWPHALDGYRIVQLSDIHLGPILDRRFAAHLVERCRALAPDLIVITGDLVDGSVTRVAAEVAPLAALHARHGVFFITGNHDHYSGADAWVRRVQSLGIRVLRNERVRLGDGDAVFDLAGVDDHHAALFGGAFREDVPAALAGRDPARALILLAHDPATFREAAGFGVDLQLSGHTHGGQIWPFNYFVRLATPFVAGHYRLGTAQLYVSRGTGFWGPAMRLFEPGEMTEIVMRADHRARQ
jgi:hypothetical protein